MFHRGNDLSNRCGELAYYRDRASITFYLSFYFPFESHLLRIGKTTVEMKYSISVLAKSISTIDITRLNRMLV